jgi:hypothetical protein
MADIKTIFIVRATFSKVHSGHIKIPAFAGIL